MPTYESITARIEKLRAQADKLKQKEQGVVIKRILSEMAQHGITVDDLNRGATRSMIRSVPNNRKSAGKAAASKQAGGKLKLSPKYRDPNTGNTWNGHGRAPSWISDVADRDVFLIGKRASKEAPAKKATAAKTETIRKATSKLAGRKLNLSPKYRDPQTGSEWTGHGKAPSWIRDVADRNTFLLSKAGEPKARPAKSGVARKTVAKKAATKKSATRKVEVTQKPVEAATQE